MPNKYIDDFDEFYEKAINNPTNEIFNYGKISKKVRCEIEILTGKSIDDYQLKLQNRQLRHILLEHGELSKNEIEISKEAIRNIYRIIENFEEIRLSINFNKFSSNRIEIYIKINGYMVVIEEISKKRYTLWIKTIYLQKK